MTKRFMALVLAGTILFVGATLAPLGFGAAAPAVGGLTIQAVGVVDPARIQKEFPAYKRLMDLKMAYDKEFNSYNQYLVGQFDSYQVELKRQMDAESEGKTEADKQSIEAKYRVMAQEKKAESEAKLKAKYKELQDKLDGETKLADAKVLEAITAVTKEKGILIVLNKTAVYLGGVDITTDVIARGQAPK